MIKTVLLAIHLPGIALMMSACSPDMGTNTLPPAERIAWEDLMPEGEEARLTALYAEQIAASGTITEGDVTDVAQQIGTFQTVDAMDGKRIRLPGYTVPFDFGLNAEITEFLLVPYYGACLHIPPPPPNQTIFVTSQVPIRLRDLKQAVWIEGVLRTQTRTSDLADTAYIVELDGMEPYQN